MGCVARSRTGGLGAVTHAHSHTQPTLRGGQWRGTGGEQANSGELARRVKAVVGVRQTNAMRGSADRLQHCLIEGDIGKEGSPRNRRKTIVSTQLILGAVAGWLVGVIVASLRGGEVKRFLFFEACLHDNKLQGPEMSNRMLCRVQKGWWAGEYGVFIGATLCFLLSSLASEDERDGWGSRWW
ncbi:hypothetical protein BGZ60DRAFT_143737 [Tricladium varicosporioides]|nr:hypothetical protein BGZ60DRAFT_143737 [Hymenoscyphus varicosporioides]